MKDLNFFLAKYQFLKNPKEQKESIKNFIDDYFKINIPIESIKIIKGNIYLKLPPNLKTIFFLEQEIFLKDFKTNFKENNFKI